MIIKTYTEIVMTKFNRRLIPISLALAGVAVMLGAFGAHALKDTLPQRLFEAFETGVEYQMYHALALLFMSLMSLHVRNSFSGRLLKCSQLVMLAGVVLFSGSLYLLAIMQERAIGMVTPIGGIALLIAWFCAFFAVIKPGAFERVVEENVVEGR